MKTYPNRILRGVVVILALMAWFWTQSLIGRRALPTQGIADRIHDVTASLNGHLADNPKETNVILVLSSLFIDSLGIFLLAWGIFGSSIRPVLGLLLIFSLRQVCQALTALLPPPNGLWHNPGFPSLLVTYGVSTDLFFSGHTSIAVYGATELARLKRTWLTWIGIAIAIFEIVVVLILRAHYTLDVFTGIVVALFIASQVGGWAGYLDSLLSGKHLLGRTVS